MPESAAEWAARLDLFGKKPSFTRPRMLNHLKNLETHARESLKPALEGQLSPAEQIDLYKRFLKVEEHRVLQYHRGGAGGLVFPLFEGLIAVPAGIGRILGHMPVQIRRAVIPPNRSPFP